MIGIELLYIIIHRGGHHATSIPFSNRKKILSSTDCEGGTGTVTMQLIILTLIWWFGGACGLATANNSVSQQKTAL